jgi:uncharacterized protein (TIGR02302 family)
MEYKDSARRAQLRLKLARVSLTWERLMRRGWAPAVIGLLFVSAIQSDFLPLINPFAHLAVLIALGLAFVIAVAWFANRFRLPTASAARRRLEEHNGLDHLPLETLNDTKVGGEGPIGTALWRLHQKRAAAALDGISTPPPRPTLAGADKYGLTTGALLVFILTLAMSWGDFGPRFARAMAPFERIDTNAVSVALWLTPPDYTGQAPVSLNLPLVDTTEESDQVFTVPEGSRLVGTVTAAQLPTLSVGTQSLAFEDVLGGYKLEAPLTESGPIELSLANRVVGRWQIKIAPDVAPQAAFADIPHGTQRQALDIDYVAADDYGVTALSVVIHPRDEDRTQEPPLVLDIPLDGRNAREITGTEFHDLTAHSWAGLEVGIFLEATDAAGQVGRSDVETITLPERVFTHPVAIRLAAARKVLLTEKDMEAFVAVELLNIGADPAAFDHQTGIFLGLRIAARRVVTSGTPEEQDAVAQLIWDMALAIEEGELFLAEQELRDAEEALRNALNDPNTSVAELEALMQRFNDALQSYLSAMAERASEGEDAPFDMAPMMEGFETQDLNRMIEQMRDMTRAGARDAAREMLSQMRALLENMRVLEPGQQMQNIAEAMQALNELQNLSQQQEELLNETMRRLQEQGEAADLSDLQAAQQELQSALTELFEQLQDAGLPIPPQLNQAGSDMDEAAQNMGIGEGDQALEAEGRALDQLQQAGQLLQGVMQQMMGDGMITNGPGGQGGNPSQRDPLGRPNQPDTSSIDVPVGEELNRAWETLQELHRRAADPNRSDIEIDYIDRLLQRF